MNLFRNFADFIKSMDKLYILPFDHRGSFVKMFGYGGGNLVPETVAALADLKHAVYEGFLRAIALGVPKETAAILVDEQFGKKIHEEARGAGITRILSIEKSGQDEFDFEYGDAFGMHIDALAPQYVKVLVRYNPAGDAAMNERQCDRLKRVSDFCKANGYKFLFELLVVPMPEELRRAGGDKERYEQTMRWEGMRGSIVEIRGRGVEPDIWKVEGLDDAAQMAAVVSEARAGGRTGVGVVVLGRGERGEKVAAWLTVAANVEGVVGFAVGRTVFKQALLDFHAKKISREEAVRQIAENYKQFADLFSRARAR